jgi:hypothetical protein
MSSIGSLIATHLSLITLATLVVACSLPPGGGVSGTVRGSTGEAVPDAKVTLTSEPRILGIRVPFVEPAGVVLSSDDTGHFGVIWPHGDTGEGPLLEVSAPGYLPAAQRLGVGYVECDVVLAPVGMQDEVSRVECRLKDTSGGDHS